MNEALEEWLAGRPQVIQDLARSHPPDGSYQLSSGTDDDVYMVHSYAEDGTIKAIRHTQLPDGQLIPMWAVFGMRPEDLVPASRKPDSAV